MDHELISHLPETLKVIAICSVGYDQYNLDGLKARGIQLYNTPSLGADDVADTVLWHILESFRFYKRFEKSLRSNGHVIQSRKLLQTKGYNHEQGMLGHEQDAWLKSAFPFGEFAGGQVVHSPKGRNCGIIGLGRIGQCVAARARAIGMKVSYTQRNENTDVDYQYSDSVLEMCSTSDVVVVCCPGNESTRDLISREVIDSMPQGSKLINVGRGFVIDEDHAIKSLQRGHLGWLALDVYTGEPIVDARLLGREDVGLTPHMASSTKENFDATAVYALGNVWSVVVDGVDGQSRVC